MDINTNCDSYILEPLPDLNRGSETEIIIYSLATNQNYRGYIKFDISSIPGTINNVTLRLYCNSVEGTQPRTYEVRRVTSSWTESGITWNNIPTVTDTNKVEFVTSGASVWHEVDVTSMFNDESGSDFSVYVKDKNEESGGGGWGVCRYSSRTHSNANIPHVEINSYYVKTTGNDGLDGKSWTNAWATVNKAATTLADGSTVHIGFGDYTAEPASNKIAPQNVGTLGIYYLPETATTGGGTGTVSVEQNA